MDEDYNNITSLVPINLITTTTVNDGVLSNVTSVDDDVLQLVQYLNIFLLTPVILIGLVGNVLSMLTWSRGCHRETSTATLLTALAIMDTIVLTMPAFEFWSAYVLGLLLRTSNIFLCKILGFFSYFSPTSSSWIVVLVTAERFVSIWFPVKVRFICTKTKILFSLLGTLSVVAAVYTPFLIGIELYFEEGNNSTMCDLKSEGSFYQKYFSVLMWIDLCILFMIPFFLIVIFNALILYKLLKSRKLHIRQGRYTAYRTRVANSFTVRAIALSIAVLVCLLPVTTLEVYHAQTQEKKSEVISILSHIMLYANSALNFILYCVIGTGFRKDMKAVLTKMCTNKVVRLSKDASSVNEAHFHSLLSRRNGTQF